MGIRPAQLAGAWYSSRPEELRREVRSCLAQAEALYGRALAGDGCEPIAVIAPHAGLAFSGAVAAVAYRLLRDAFERVDAFVVFGACHRASLRVPAVWAEGAWETPLGDIEVDEVLAERLVEAGVGEVGEAPHRGDNAIELQTPFIKSLFPEAKMVPVAVSSRPDSWRRGELAAGVAAEYGKRVVAVASTDLTHYGASFGVMPAGTGEAALAWTRENDRRFIDSLTRLDLENIVAVAERHGSACGGGAAAVAAGWAKAAGCGSGRLLAHTNSHEVMPMGEAEHFVGYASLVFEVCGKA